MVDVPNHPGMTYFAAWTAASDNSGGSGVGKYQVLSSASSACDGTPHDIANVTKIELVTDSTYPNFCVRAVDQVGNASDWASALLREVESETFYRAFGGVTAIERRDANNAEDLSYTIADALGSATMTIRADGSVVSNVGYLPYGQERWTDVNVPTDKGYTGQRNETGFGLMDYNARYYSPALGRFLSPDTLIPDLKDANALDRYAYANNHPIMYNDPTGHSADPITFLVCAFAVLAPIAVTVGANAPQIMQSFEQINFQSAWQPTSSNDVYMMMAGNIANLGNPLGEGELIGKELQAITQSGENLSHELPLLPAPKSFGNTRRSKSLEIKRIMQRLKYSRSGRYQSCF
jgi:RHS repeat-associated protein